MQLFAGTLICLVLIGLSPTYAIRGALFRSGRSSPISSFYSSPPGYRSFGHVFGIYPSYGSDGIANFPDQVGFAKDKRSSSHNIPPGLANRYDPYAPVSFLFGLD